MAGINDRTGVGNPLCGWLCVCVCWKAKEKKRRQVPDVKDVS